VVAFVAVVAAVRGIICRAATHTARVLLAQPVHVSATGSLVGLSPLHGTPAHEALWYAVSGGLPWVIAAAILVGARRPAAPACAHRHEDRQP